MSQPSRILFLATTLCVVFLYQPLASRAADSLTGLFNSGIYGGKDLNIKEAVLTKDGEVRITFTTLTETMYFCPGANGKTTEERIELSFVRESYKNRPNVTYPAKSADAKKSIDQYILIDAQGKPIYLNTGKGSIKIYPTN